MTRLSLDLPTDVALALRRLAAEQLKERETVAVEVLRDWLIAHGYLEVHEFDEETETGGNG